MSIRSSLAATSRVTPGCAARKRVAIGGRTFIATITGTLSLSVPRGLERKPLTTSSPLSISPSAGASRSSRRWPASVGVTLRVVRLRRRTPSAASSRRPLRSRPRPTRPARRPRRESRARGRRRRRRRDRRGWGWPFAQVYALKPRAVSPARFVGSCHSRARGREPCVWMPAFAGMTRRACDRGIYLRRWSDWRLHVRRSGY